MTPAENHPLPAVRVKAESYGQRPAGSAGSLGRIPTVTGERIRAAAVLRGADACERPEIPAMKVVTRRYYPSSFGRVICRLAEDFLLLFNERLVPVLQGACV